MLVSVSFPRIRETTLTPPINGQRPSGSSDPSDSSNFPDNFGGFGGGGVTGQFGGGSRAATPMNASLYTDISDISGVAAVEEILEASEGDTNQTITMMGRSFTTQITDYTIKGIPLTSELITGYSVLPTTILEGRNLQAERKRRRFTKRKQLKIL